jgi:hypothetical protein
MRQISQKASKAHPLANTTPFPNVLFELMPTLKDSEWRVLCLIVRQTGAGMTAVAERKRLDDAKADDEAHR